MAKQEHMYVCTFFKLTNLKLQKQLLLSKSEYIGIKSFRPVYRHWTSVGPWVWAHHGSLVSLAKSLTNKTCRGGESVVRASRKVFLSFKEGWKAGTFLFASGHHPLPVTPSTLQPSWGHVGRQPEKQAENESSERKKEKKEKKTCSQITWLNRHPWRHPSAKLLDRWLINDFIVQALLSCVLHYLQLNSATIPASPRYWKI